MPCFNQADMLRINADIICQFFLRQSKFLSCFFDTVASIYISGIKA